MINERKVWTGAAGIIVVKNKIMMVKGKETKCWSLPSGEIEKGETSEQACAREVWEETGFKVEVVKSIQVKKAIIEN